MTHLLFKTIDSSGCMSNWCDDQTYTILNLDNVRDKYRYLQNECCPYGDPRLYRGGSDDYIKLDRPPLMTNTESSIPYHSKENYNDIYGDVIHYIPNERKMIYINPLFSNNYKVAGYLYKDPMGSVKPHFVQVRNNDKPIHTLSWINDSELHRETLMSRQMYNINNRFEALL